ncbi:MAG: RNase adapter RapZ [Lachnospiraceae bacterium]|nr:RNase adapter RapZ [Lachnospiraceae bacterium]
MRLVVVTGMSGGGKRTAMKMLEDVGYYCVDNLPVQLIDKFVDLITDKDTEYSKVALGIDVRADMPFKTVFETLKELKKNPIRLDILFLECSDSVLLKRYKETRRMHPLAADGRMEEGIEKEREILKDIKSIADYVIDTSNLLTRQFKEEIDRIFVEDKAYDNLMVNILSFGFKNGIPADADLVFDVRFLPNPFYVDELKRKTGLDAEVQDYVMGFKEAGQFLDMLENMLKFLLPNYIKEGKHQLVIAIGCTGGHHRSVTLAGKLYERMQRMGNYGITLNHRDINKGADRGI